MSTVYTVMVSDGDTGEIVEAIFSTEDKAIAYTEEYNLRHPQYDHAYVESREVDSPYEFEPCRSFVVRFSPAGEPVRERSYCRVYEATERVHPLHMLYESRYGSWIDVTVRADDIDSAIKIAAERRAQFLAEKEGIA